MGASPTPAPKQVKNRLGPNIKAMRKMAGLTQAELATAVGLERTSITNIERGQQALSTEHVFNIARACGFEVEVRFTKVTSPCTILI